MKIKNAIKALKALCVEHWWFTPLLLHLGGACVLILGFVGFQRSNQLPPIIRLAAGQPEDPTHQRKRWFYYKFAQEYKQHLEKTTRSTVKIIPTSGASQNREKLLAGEADLALLQTSTSETEGTKAIAPVFKEAIHVLVRKSVAQQFKIQKIKDLRGRQVAIGVVGSGTQDDANNIIKHYHLEGLKTWEVNPGQLLNKNDKTLEAAFWTSCFSSESLQQVLETGDFTLLEIDDTPALTMRYPFYEAIQIPIGLYRESPQGSVPAHAVPTVAVDGFLAVRADASPQLVSSALEALYQSDLRTHEPALISKEQAAAWDKVPMHVAARHYFEPSERILNRFANWMEGLNGLYNLIALGAIGILFLWKRRDAWRKREMETQLDDQKNQLNALIQQTIAIEQEQMTVEDPEHLKRCLDRVTQIKQSALNELTHEKLRDHQIYFIFLLQCSNLILHISQKIILHSVKNAPQEEFARALAARRRPEFRESPNPFPSSQLPETAPLADSLAIHHSGGLP